jgi:hypothetical protein
MVAVRSASTCAKSSCWTCAMPSAMPDSSVRSNLGSVRQKTSGASARNPASARRSHSPRMLSLMPKISWNTSTPGPESPAR